MLTLLFDGVAYGMLLFVLAVGLAVTLGLMNFINLAHGAFAMAGGYITVLLMNRAGVPFLACLPLAFIGAGLLGARARADALPAHVRAAASRPGAVLDRPGLHGGDGGRLLRRLDAAEHPGAGVAAGPLRHRVDRHRPLSPLHHRRLRGAGAGAAMGAGANALRQPPARRRRRPARGAAASAWTSTASSSRPSSSAAAWPDSAARSAPRCSDSTRRSRSSS